MLFSGNHCDFIASQILFHRIGLHEKHSFFSQVTAFVLETLISRQKSVTKLILLDSLWQKSPFKCQRLFAIEKKQEGRSICCFLPSQHIYMMIKGHVIKKQFPMSE